MKGKYFSLFAGIRFLIQIFWKYQKSALVYLSLYCLISGVLPFTAIVIPKYILDELLSLRNVYNLVLFVALLLFSALFGNVLCNFLNTRYFLHRLQCSQKYSMITEYSLYEADFEHVESAKFLDMYGRAITYLTADGMGFGGVLQKFSTVIAQLITLMGIIGIISVLSPFIILIFIALTIITTWYNSKVKKLNIQYNLERVEVDRRCGYHESLFWDRRFAKEIRINILGNWISEKYKGFLLRLFGFYKKSNYNNLKSQVFSSVASFIQQGIAYAYLIYSVLNGKFGIGTFTMYLAAITAFSGAMSALMDSVVDIRRFSDYYNALDVYTKIPRRQREGKRLRVDTNIQPIFEFQNVSFKYPGQNDYSLKNINLKFSPGEKISIVGENGAGKTTFTKLLMRLYRPTEGIIMLNGVDIQDYDFDEYERLFSVVFQDFALYSMSLRDNVANGFRVGDEKIKEVLRQSGFGNKLDKLEKGLDTPVYKNLDETGFEPSGGEGQKIAMARALLKDGRVVILDEPTAALDPRAEYEIYMNFNRMVQGKTAVFISHRLASVKFCDRTLVFKNGEIVESGSHDELMAKQGLYHELFTMQAQFYERERTGEAS